MKTRLLAILGFAAFAAFGQGRVAYESYVDVQVQGAKATANSAVAQVNALNSVVTGNDFALVTTNYDSFAKMPTLSARYKLQDGSGNYGEIWNELNMWKWFFGTWWPSNAYTKGQADARFADKAWGLYESGTGYDSPDGRLWVTQPVVMSSGMAYVPHYMESGGAIWVLTANGLAPTVTTNGFFRLSDDAGKALFEVVKGDKATVGAYCDGITVDGSVMTLTYATESQPTLEGCSDLQLADWKDPAESGCTVSWSGGAGAYVATVAVPSAFARYFIRGTYETGAESYIRNLAPVRVDSGLVTADGVKIRPVVSGQTVTWEVVK